MSKAPENGRRILELPLVQAICRELERQNLLRSMSPVRPGVLRTSRVLTVCIIVGICYFIASNVLRYIEWPPPVYSSPDVLNLTKQGITWDAYYGQPVDCGGVDCHLLPDYPSEHFTKQVVLPTHEFPLNDYRAGDLVYYRAKVEIPEGFFRDRGTIALHSVYIWAERFEFYVNGERIATGRSKLLNLAIPENDLNSKKELVLAFKIDPGTLPYQGLSHYGEILLGPLDLFEPLQHKAQEIQTTYYVWQLLPRFTIGLIFGFIALAMGRYGENFQFFLFVVVAASSIYFHSSYPKDWIPQWLPLTNFALALEVASSLLFIVVMQRYFRRFHPLFKPAMLALALGVGLIFAAVHLAVEPQKQWLFLLRVDMALRMGGTLYALYLATTTAIYLYASGRSRSRLQASLVIAAFLLSSLVVYVLNLAGIIDFSYGPVSKTLHDTLIMLVIAAMHAVEFGQTVGQRDMIKGKLTRFLDKKVAESMLADPNVLRPVQNEVTVMFCDIRSFTTISETFEPEQVLELLNGYLEVMVRVIDQHGGVVDKFGGDSIMAVWGVPKEVEGHAILAARCAIEMRKALAEFNAKRQAAGLFTIAIGMGLHSGRAIAGAVGSMERTEYTVIGDTVNTAARLESLTKELGADIVISDALRTRIEGQALLAQGGTMPLRGKREPMSVYRLIGVIDDTTGALLCHDPIYLAHLPQDPGPGVVALDVENLRIPEYGPRRYPHLHLAG